MCTSPVDPAGQFVSVTAAGTDQSTATQLCRQGQTTVVLVTSSDTEGIVLPSGDDSFVGDVVEFHGQGFKLYPASGESISDLAENLDASITPPTVIRRLTSTNWDFVSTN